MTWLFPASGLRHPSFALFAVIVIALALSGCSAAFQGGQVHALEWGGLGAGQRAGQTFVAEYDGLASVQFMLQGHTPGSGEVRLHLRADPQTSTDLAVTSLPLSAIGGPAWYGFFFKPQSASQGQSYYAFIEIIGEGSLQMGRAPGDAYLDGALYWEGAPAEGQSAFQLTYSRRWAVLGLGRELLRWGGWLIVGMFLFLLPGWGVLARLWPGWATLGLGEKAGLSLGVSAALYPVVSLWCQVVSWRPGALIAWGLPLIGAALLIPSWLTAGRGRQAGERPCLHLSWADGVSLFVVLLILGSRLWALRGLAAPMWGDSVQHTVMAQLILENGGLFHSWEPYAPYQSLTVQYGFSLCVALFSWLTQSEITLAALVVGQLLNAAAIFTLYPLALKFSGGNRWAGAAALLIGGLLSPMPAMYINWGRYAQLAGQVILPAAIWLTWDMLTRPPRPGRSNAFWYGAAIALTGTTLTGMTLAYYRMPFYYGTSMLALLLIWGLTTWRFHLRTWAGKLAGLGITAAFMLLLALPWGRQVSGSTLESGVIGGMQTTTPLENVLAEYKIWVEWANYVPGPLLTLCVLALAWGLWRKQSQIIVLALWTALLAAFHAGKLIHLPGANMLQNFAVLIALYIPVSLAGGWLFGEVGNALETKRRAAGGPLLALGMILLALWGGWTQGGIAQPEAYALVTHPDRRALAWVQEHTPADAIFLVEGFRIYSGYSAVGSDAGWWLPLYTGRGNTMPPQYALMNERPNQPDYSRQVVALVASLEGQPPDNTASLRHMCALGVTHVYIGQAQGNASASRTTQLFAPGELAASPAFRLLYHQDRVFVFALEPQACAQP